MSFVEASKSGFARIIDFSGRSSRSEYWWFLLFYFLVSIVVNILQMVLIGIGLEIVGAILSFLLLLAFIVPSISVAVRRLHDTGRSGWWILIALIPLLGALILLYFLVLGGDEDENRFGANPLSAA